MNKRDKLKDFLEKNPTKNIEFKIGIWPVTKEKMGKAYEQLLEISKDKSREYMAFTREFPINTILELNGSIFFLIGWTETDMIVFNEDNPWEGKGVSYKKNFCFPASFLREKLKLELLK